MSKNIIFCFTGTGNSLKLAKDIADDLGDCNVFSTQAKNLKLLDLTYDRIGFVFPAYFGGLPNQVREFLSQMDLKNNQSAYYCVIVTFGGFYANALRQAASIIRQKGLVLHYSNSVKMVSNDILLYEIPKDKKSVEDTYNERVPIICGELKQNKTNKQHGEIHIVRAYNRFMLNRVAESDRHYSVSGECTGCEICNNVCPAENIQMKNNKPEFQHKCEQCLSCIHFCPQRAINYKNTTQRRSRYHNPEITPAALTKFYNQ